MDTSIQYAVPPDGSRPQSYDINNPLKKIGKLAERAIIDWFTSRGYVVEDVSDDPEHQDQSIDLLIHRDNQWLTSVEVKHSSKVGPSGSFFVELGRIWHHRQPQDLWQTGWSIRSAARWVVYVNLRDRAAYRIRTNQLRSRLQDWVERHQGSLNVHVVASDAEKTTLGVYLPYHWVSQIVEAMPLG